MKVRKIHLPQRIHRESLGGQQKKNKEKKMKCYKKLRGRRCDVIYLLYIFPLLVFAICSLILFNSGQALIYQRVT